MITRPEILVRSASLWPQGTVKYDPAKRHQPDGYRQDSAGFISMCWNIPPGSQGGPSIVTLDTDGWMYGIQPRQLRAGDALGVAGPGAGTSGMLVLFEAWVNGDPATNMIITWDHLPDIKGPLRRVRPWPGSQWHCYRFMHVVDGA